MLSFRPPLYMNRFRLCRYRMSRADKEASSLAASCLMSSISRAVSVTFSGLDELAGVEVFKGLPRVIGVTVGVFDDHLGAVDKLDGDAARELRGLHQVHHDCVGEIGFLESAEHHVFLVRLFRHLHGPVKDTLTDLFL